MHREEIHRIIRTNLEKAGLHDIDIRIQPDPISGWRISVISKGFEEKIWPSGVK